MAFGGTGIDQVDAAVGGLITGDNVVWLIDDESVYAALTDRFVSVNAPPGGRVLYVDFGGHVIAEAGNVDILEATARTPFTKPGALADEVERRLRDSRPACIVVDDLTRLRRRWSEADVSRFFGRACPAMLQAGVTAYWSAGTAVGRTVTDSMRQITQCMIDVRGGRLRVIKAEGRPSALEGITHRLDVGDGEITVTPAPGGGRLPRGLVALRRQFGLTQQELAAIAGITPSAISQAEAGVRGLSLDTVVAIAERLELPVDRVLGAGETRSYRLARHDRSRLIAPGNVVALASDASVGLRAYLVRLDDSEVGAPPFEHRGTMLFAPIQGVMQVDLDDDRPVLRSGDVLVVEATSVRAWRNLRHDPVACYWVLRD
jgi:transcriptional regulator with XRE-family HTH domain